MPPAHSEPHRVFWCVVSGLPKHRPEEDACKLFRAGSMVAPLEATCACHSVRASKDAWKAPEPPQAPTRRPSHQRAQAPNCHQAQPDERRPLAQGSRCSPMPAAAVHGRSRLDRNPPLCLWRQKSQSALGSRYQPPSQECTSTCNAEASYNCTHRGGS